MDSNAKKPRTSNKEAQALIDLAQSKCVLCRTNWRLKIGTFEHAARNASIGLLCQAQGERQALRALAASKKPPALTLADFHLIEQAIRIAVEDGSLLSFASPGRIDLLRFRLRHLEAEASR